MTSPAPTDPGREGGRVLVGVKRRVLRVPSPPARDDVTKEAFLLDRDGARPASTREHPATVVVGNGPPSVGTLADLT
jgi:hypothetical protein